MQFNDTSTAKSGILQNIEVKVFGDSGYGKITGDTNKLSIFTNLVNRGLDRFVFLAMTADGRWQWDDDNYTDLSIAQTDIVNGQRDYQFALEHLVIEKVLIADSNGTWKILDPIDESDRKAITYLQNNTGNVGVPTKYDKRGNTIFLDAVPNYSGTNALKVYFKRGASYFTTTDTTKVPGFPSIFHKYLVNFSSTHYAVDREMSQAKNWFPLLTEEEKSIQTFYSQRNKDEIPRLRPAYQNNK
jgi:hypothetical protein